MPYKLSIADVVKVPVKFSLNNAGKIASFNFTLTCTRLSQDDIKARLDNKDLLVVDFLKEVITDWQGQTLVVEEDGKPAEFSADALDFMLATAGVAIVVYSAYFKECGAKEKN